MKSYWKNYPQLATQLDAVKALLQQRIHTDNAAIQSALQTFATSGGKLLRPAFFCLFANCANQREPQDERIIKLASSLEVLHMATLIHDDVIDDAPKRRGQVSIQSRFGKDVAVYAGDLLFTVFFDLIIEARLDHELLAVNAQTMRNILNGELNQLNLRYTVDQTAGDYFTSIHGKTAALFELACYEGALTGGGNPALCQTAQQIGRNIGMTFQILDDILDYSAPAAKLNKPVLEDLASGVFSLPVILATKANPTALKPLLAKGKQLTEADMHEIQTLVQQSGGLTQAQAIARSYTSEALTLIKTLPHGTPQRALTKLTKELLKRQQ